MANGKIKYHTTDYEFEVNFIWESPPQKIVEEVVNITPGGKVTRKLMHEAYSRTLNFENIPDTQVAALQAAHSFGMVTFYPTGDGAGEPFYYGLFQVVSGPTPTYENQNTMTCYFRESVET